MFESAVCLNIVRRVQEQCSASWTETYYEMGQTQRNKNHSACTEATCFANDLQTSVIRPGHTSPKCSCPLLGADPHQLREILASHGAALLRLDEKDENIEMNVEPMVKDMKYFAISHALADGICNTERNELPQCQLRRILRSVQSAMLIEGLPQDYPVYVWIDITCLPIRSSPFDSVAVICQTIRFVMGNALAVVVLDTDIAILSRNSSYAVLYLRISFSSWASRLWTLFEAIIAQKLLFECKNGVMELMDLLESSPDVTAIEDAARFRSFLYARLGKFRMRHRDDLVLLQHALEGCRTSAESDSSLLKNAITSLFLSKVSAADDHRVNFQPRL